MFSQIQRRGFARPFPLSLENSFSFFLLFNESTQRPFPLSLELLSFSFPLRLLFPSYGIKKEYDPSVQILCSSTAYKIQSSGLSIIRAYFIDPPAFKVDSTPVQRRLNSSYFLQKQRSRWRPKDLFISILAWSLRTVVQRILRFG